jgi:predicted transcriptional regulator
MNEACDMAEVQTKQVKVQIDANGMHYESSGSAEEIMPQILQFISKALPTYDIARRLMYVPDLARLADNASEIVKMTNSNQLFLTRNDLPAERSISVVLFIAHLAAKISKRPSDSMNVKEISTAVGKAPKTVRNAIVSLQRTVLIERADRGSYRITQKGLMELESSLSEPSKGS